MVIEMKKIKELLNKHNKLLYSVPYQHFTNAIEHYFSILKSRSQKLEGLTYNELKLNIGCLLVSKKLIFIDIFLNLQFFKKISIFIFTHTIHSCYKNIHYL